ncbi:NADH dehydrogenase [Planotetraspora thailandica]|uniref:NADH dehydrogenase n=1 Tax=Planotetraspora thailandica TaxID=487172 RepID=A0A8J3XTA2_9ACTN|nr:NAD(P)/FAD-dependent oxidoreductase [Planotetraspora thailandica]GII54127.1 NADH dehydrogenase [Planotetraspora thailandica]
MTVPRILIVGGGYVGMYAALRLQRRLRRELARGQVRITVADYDSYMTYQPFLPEAAAGNIEPRHVVVPLRRVLRPCEILSGRVRSVSLADRTAEFRPHEGPDYTIHYDYLVFAPGSVSRLLPIPGLTEHGIGFKTVEEAIHLRNHVLLKLDVAASTTDERVRRRALTFVFVGGGYAGVEVLGELEDMAADACRSFEGISRGDMRWVLVEASDRILPEVGPDMARWTADELRRRGIEVRTRTLLRSAENGHIVLSDGQEFDAETLVWTAGVKPHPLSCSGDLPLDEKGRVKVTATMRIQGTGFAFSAGDVAAVPDLTRPGEFCAPSAQHAVRQAGRLADNVVATMKGRPCEPYAHRNAGSVASLGLYKGVAEVYGYQVRGFPAWFMHRTYHLMRMPTFNKKSRILMDWTLGLLFPREIVSLGAFQRPRAEFEAAARTSAPTRP